MRPFSAFPMFIGVLAACLGLPARAADEIRFAASELAAFQVLAKPETTELRLDGRVGQFRPGPPLRFWGVEDQDFEIDLNFGGALVDLRFDDLQARAPTVALEDGRIVFEIAFRDREKAIRSRLGAVSLRGVVLRAGVRFAANSPIRLEYERGEIVGELKGTGLLKPKWVMDAIRKSALKSLRAQVERALAREKVQASIENGLLLWARFSVDRELARVLPGTVEAREDAITYRAE